MPNVGPGGHAQKETVSEPKWRDNFWGKILQKLGIKDTDEYQTAFALWAYQEGEGIKYNNPLGLDDKKTDGRLLFHGGHQARFKDEAAGIEQTVAFLKQANFKDLIRGMKEGVGPRELWRLVNESIAKDGGWGKGMAKHGYPQALQVWAATGRPPKDAEPKLATYLYGATVAKGGLPLPGQAPPAKAPPPPAPGPPQEGAPAPFSPLPSTPAPAAAPAAPPLPPYKGPMQFWEGGQLFNVAPIPEEFRAQAVEDIKKWAEKPGNMALVMSRSEKAIGYDAWAMKDPELAAIMVWGGMQSVDNDLIQGALDNTNFWKTHSANQRYAIAIQNQDPATWRRVLASSRATIARVAAGIGVTLTGAELAKMAIRYASDNMGSTGTIPDSGVNTDQIVAMVQSQYNFKKMGLTTGGDVSSLADSYEKLAGQYMVPMSKNAIGAHVQAAIHNDYNQPGFITGQDSAFEQYLKQQAVNKYPYMKDAIDSGITPYQWADPYRQEASSILEKNPNEIDMNSPEFQNALTSIDKKTGQKQPMSLADFRQELMTNAKYGYQYTNQAQQAAWTTGAELLRSFGVISGSVA